MGTAGHIDHGKTALVKRLTGVDTDRLEEEKRRGMTIELGFAPLTLPSGNVISIIDVPGHEKFVKTMVSGVTGIDFVMLVVAADEGVMPQTREHIDILSLLNVKTGVVALTKTDLVEDEWLVMVKEDVKKALVGTTLETIPIIPVSSVDGKGIDNLLVTLELLARTAAKTNVRELFRLPVDRVFTMMGYGTVITGTISGGKVSKGDVVEILPSGLTARIRGIQVHNQSAEYASAGDRCALNLSGIEKDEVERGDVVAAQGIIKPTRIVDAVLYTVKGREGIAHNQRVHVHTGTKEVLARVRILGAEEIPGGTKGYVQLRFEEPIAALREDRFIIRSFSPVITLGGGWIVFHSTQNRQRFLKESMDALSIGEQGNLKEIVDSILKSSGKLLSIDDLWRELFVDKDEIQKILMEEIDMGQTLALKEISKYLSKDLYYKFIEKVNTEFQQLYKKYPFRYQIDREEIKSKVFNDWDSKGYTAILNHFVQNNLFELEGNFIIQSAGHSALLHCSPCIPEKIAINKILALKETSLVEKSILEYGLNAGSLQQIQQATKIEVNKVEEIEKFLIQISRIINLGNGILIHIEVLKKSVEKIRNILDEHGSATASQIRDYLGSSRKIAIALLEHLDRIEVTQRVDDTRKPGVHYMDHYI